MDYLIPDFDREVKARVGVMARCVRRSLYKPEDGSSISSIYAKVEGEKGSVELSSDLQVQEPCVHALQEW